jgi:hypothetical protein
MFNFVGRAVNEVVDKFIDWVVPLETFNFEFGDED